MSQSSSMISLIVGAILVRILSKARAKVRIDKSGHSTIIKMPKISWFLRNSSLRKIDQYLTEKEPTAIDPDLNIIAAHKWLQELTSKKNKSSIIDKPLMDALRQFSLLSKVTQHSPVDPDAYSECLKIIKLNMESSGIRLSLDEDLYNDRVSFIIYQKAKMFVELRSTYYDKKIDDLYQMIPKNKSVIAENFSKLLALIRKLDPDSISNRQIINSLCKKSKLNIKLKSFSSQSDAKAAYIILKAFVPHDDPDIGALEFATKGKPLQGYLSVDVDAIEELVIKYLRVPCSIFSSSLGSEIFKNFIEEIKSIDTEYGFYSQNLRRMFVYREISSAFADYGHKDLVEALTKLLIKGEPADFDIEVDTSIPYQEPLNRDTIAI